MKRCRSRVERCEVFHRRCRSLLAGDAGPLPAGIACKQAPTFELPTGIACKQAPTFVPTTEIACEQAPAFEPTEIACTSVQRPWSLYPYLNGGRIKYLVAITVNAKPGDVSRIDQSAATPGLREALSVVANGPMGNYSDETVQYLADVLEAKRQAADVRKKFAELQGRPAPVSTATKFYAVELTFQDVADPQERAYLSGLATSFDLPREAIDRLRAAAARLLEESPQIKQLRADLASDFER